MEKVKTYTFSTDEGTGFVTQNIKEIFEELKAMSEDEEFLGDEGQITINIWSEEKYTQKEIDNMHEWSGF